MEPDQQIVSEEKIKILIVDTNPDNIFNLTQIIQNDDFQIHSFLRFDNAIASLSVHDYALAIFDSEVMGMDCAELSVQIKDIKSHGHLPILFVTSQLNNDDTFLEGYFAGAVDLIFKPFNPFLVRSKVNVFVELSKQQTQLKNQLVELERLKISAESATNVKSEFLANMSHEIRAPLAAVLGFADLLSQSHIPKGDMKIFSSAIKRNGQILLRLIDDILDISTTDAHQILINKQVYSMNDLLNDVKLSLSFKAQEKGVNLVLHSSKEIDQRHIFAPIRMKQILLNIIGNAIKFSRDGDINVAISFSKISPEEDLLSILVKNNGAGLSQDQASKLFKPFTQADKEIKNKFGGTGLGLVISRQLARAMGGDVTLVNYGINEGAEFKITAILECLNEKNKLTYPLPTYHLDKKIEIEKTFANKKILVVDDSKDNQILLDYFFKKTNAHLTFANNGKEAVSLCHGHAFDIILMDIQMPVMSGLEATQTIRRFDRSTPILALTAYANKIEHEKCLESGCSDILVKPLNREYLLTAIEFYLSK